MHRRVIRIGMWAALGVSVLLGAAVAVGVARPTWVGRGQVVVGVTAGRLEVARTTGITLTRQGNAWGLGNLQGFASILVQPESAWLPTTSSAQIAMGGPATAMALRVVYVPLWPWLVLSAAAAGGLWWKAGKRIAPGHCRECGYDLRGLSGEKCPECGAGRASAVTRALRTLSMVLLPDSASSRCSPCLRGESA